MHKILLISLSLIASIYAIEIPIEKVEVREFGKSVDLNSKVIQLSSSKQSVMTLLDGRIKKYYVKAGEKIKKGQKIALIESIQLSQMTAEHISLKEQYISLNANYNANKKLHKKGIVSLQELNTGNIQRNEMLAKIETLNSQLATLGIQTNNIKNTSSKYILYAHSDGIISELLQPQHAVVSKDTQIISIIKEQAFYLKSYLPLSYSKYLKSGQKISINYNEQNIVTTINQILPALDEKTQRIVVLSSIDENVDGLFINSYINSTLYFNTDKKYTAVKKSALSFFNNEWVVFLPKDEDHDEGENEKHDEGEKESHKEETNKNEADHDENEEQQYEARDVKIIDQDDEYVAIEGLKIDEQYVSDKSYYVKSMILKSSLGEHGH